MSFSRAWARLLPLLMLVPALTLADSDRNYKISPAFFKKGALMEDVPTMALVKSNAMMLSSVPTVPLKMNTLYYRHKKGPKEYHWFSGPVNLENFGKLHAFSLKGNYLKASEVISMRFYGSQKNKAFQDEADIYFDREYIYSPRLPKLFFMKNGRWQQLLETELPGIISIGSADKNQKVVSLTMKMNQVPSEVFPVKPGMYAFAFSAPDHLPYVDAVYVPGGSVVSLKPTMPVEDTTSSVSPKSVVTLEQVAAAKSLEETEVLYDQFSADLQKNVSLVDTNQFAKIYPALKKPLSLSVSGDDDEYKDYVLKYNQKRSEALDLWRANKLGSTRLVNKALRHKLDSLQALPLKKEMVPSKVDGVYEKDSAGVNQLVAVQLTFGQNRERFDVSWSGNAEGMTADSLLALMKSGANVGITVNLVNNKPVWIHKEATLTGRHHYRYSNLTMTVDGKAVACHGGFELPDYIFDQNEVQEWLNRPREEKSQVLRDDEPKPVVKEEQNLGINMNVPRVIRDRTRGTVALIDSGSFRYYGKVVSMSPFAIHTTEVTQQFFKETMSQLDSAERIEDRSKYLAPRKPVHNINWENARKFCKILGGDLPTEAQWEFAGRADNNEGALWNLDENPDPSVYAVYKENSYNLGSKSFDYGPQPVSSKKSNAWGIFDMSGNVAEWTVDKYFMFSFWVESSNPTGSAFGSHRVYKGGSWKDKEAILNLTERDDEDPRYWSETIGFRCAFDRSLFENDGKGEKNEGVADKSKGK